MAHDWRIESDTCGNIRVPPHAYWGAQTQRSLENFSIGHEVMPLEIIYALVLIKKAAAQANYSLKHLSLDKKKIICTVCDEILAGKFDAQFPLKIWQTGSGTQTNMNVNEVISNRCIELLGGQIGSKFPIHPNDDVNKSQSSNDAFPTAMHIATRQALELRLLPVLHEFQKTLLHKSLAFKHHIKVGRTHLMDAAPITLGQEFSGYASQIHHGISTLVHTLEHLNELALGGTAVGTGLNCPQGFSEKVVHLLAELTQLPFIPAPNKFESLACHDTLVFVSGALKRLACSCLKIANDVRWMASGPRAGLNEISIPANEPGSSIMPGKVNPTQCEALTMIAVQVIGNDTAISIAASQGNFELNVYKPVIIYNILQSIQLLSDGIDSFTRNCLVGIEANAEHLEHILNRSLMLATALNPHIGYDRASQIVKKALQEDLSLKQAAEQLGILKDIEWGQLIDPRKMV